MREHPFSLGPRLRQCAAFVRPGSRMADIGTDHGYLPVWLTRRGVCPHAIGMDINAGPLARARETADTYRAADLVELRLSDGLAALKRDEVDDIVIAGMGGELIAAILGQTPWVQEETLRFILQPMSHPEKLRAFLYEHGFALLREETVLDGGRLYTVMLAAFTGHVLSPSLEECYLGRLGESTSPHTPAYLTRQAALLTKRKAGLSPEESERIDHVIQTLREKAAVLELQQKEASL